MLNTLEPSAFPMAIPLFPLRADTTLVANSGREVPPATIVRPITASDTPRFVATARKGNSGIPSNILVDPQGKIVAMDLRENRLQEVLAEKLK